MVNKILLISAKSKLAEQYRSYSFFSFLPQKFILFIWFISILLKQILFSFIFLLIRDYNYGNKIYHIFNNFLGLNEIPKNLINILVISIFIITNLLVTATTIISNRKTLEDHPLIYYIERSKKSDINIKIGYNLPSLVNIFIIFISYILVFMGRDSFFYIHFAIGVISLIFLIFLILYKFKINPKFIKIRNICIFIFSLGAGLIVANPILIYLKNIYGQIYPDSFIQRTNNFKSEIVFIFIFIIFIFNISKISRTNIFSVNIKTKKIVNIFYLNGILFFIVLSFLIGVLIQSTSIFTDYFVLIVLSSYPNILLAETLLKSNPDEYEYATKFHLFPLLEDSFNIFQIKMNSSMLKFLWTDSVIVSLIWLIHRQDLNGILIILKFFLITGIWAIISQESGFLAKIFQKSDIYNIYKQKRVSNFRSLIEGIVYIIIPIIAIPEILFITLSIKSTLLMDINFLEILILLILVFSLLKYRKKKWTRDLIRRYTLL